MTVLALIASGALSGTVASLLGVGGGVLLVPMLVLGFGLPIEQVVPVSLVCVVASSCGAAACLMERPLCDVRLALPLELATVGGALVGGQLAGLLAPAVLAVGFGLFALLVSLQFAVLRSPAERPAGELLPRRGVVGVSGSFVAGGVSALLGVGGGPIKVPLLHFGMGVPFKVASATSNLMIGVTGAASVCAYAWRGEVDLGLAAPLVVGVLVGAAIGSRLLVWAPVPLLKRVFAALLFAVSVQMLWKGAQSLWPALWS